MKKNIHRYRGNILHWRSEVNFFKGACTAPTLALQHLPPSAAPSTQCPSCFPGFGGELPAHTLRTRLSCEHSVVSGSLRLCVR